MTALASTGLIGMGLHYDGNVEFEREMYPSIAGPTLFWGAITGATPALAPGTLVLLGTLGLICTYRHPALLEKDDTSEKGDTRQVHTGS